MTGSAVGCAGGRAPGITCTNYLNEYIQVALTYIQSASSETCLYVNGVLVGAGNIGVIGASGELTATVPPGATYGYTNCVGANSVVNWAELR